MATSDSRPPEEGTARRWLRRVRCGSTTSSIVTSADGDLRIGVRHEGPQHVTVEVDGQLVRRHADLLGEVLSGAFGVHRAWFVIDLRGVTLLDPTTLAAITRRAADVRRDGALVTIVPPGTRDRSAA